MKSTTDDPNPFELWMARYPEAAGALLAVLVEPAGPVAAFGNDRTEAWAQQQIRFKVAQVGAMAWRNNVGATPAKCLDCGAPHQPIRYGLANDSAKLNKKIKSSDLILAIPRRIGPGDVGRVIAQFGSVEAKRPGWTFTGTPEEVGQAAWLTLVRRVGGFAQFSTGDLEL